MNKKLYELGSSQDIAMYTQMIQKFISEATEDIVFDSYWVALVKGKGTIFDVADFLKRQMTDGWVTMPMGIDAVVTGNRNGSPVFIYIVPKQYTEAIQFKIDIRGNRQNVKELIALCRNRLDTEKLALVKWWFNGRHGEETRHFYMPQNGLDIKPEYYPDMSDPKRFLADYLASDEAILLLAGEPGTGKTTLLRYLITEYKLTTHIIYDDKLMDRDGPFQSFLFGDSDYRPSDDDEPADSQRDIMIIEDADTILGSRERDGNKLMARFLNVSDGLIKLPNKKLVFTTNLTDFGQVDEALMRPGRCFGVVKLRTLDLHEAQDAAKVAGVPIPMVKKHYTLAEIFKSKTSRVRKVGFV